MGTCFDLEPISRENALGLDGVRHNPVASGAFLNECSPVM